MRSPRALWTRLVISLGLLLLISLPTRASHIVGGHLGLRYISRGVYDLSMTMYFDAVNANVGVRASDSVVILTVYERGRGKAGLMDTFLLTRRSAQHVAYTNAGCQINSLITLEFSYLRRVQLNPARYTSPRGYYVTWQRCCRNSITTNLPLDLGTGNAPSQAFYLEFPALTRAGAPFINSSPTGFLPLRDYGCVGRTFRYPFGGTDPDGDSLVYELVSPLTYDSVGWYGVQPSMGRPAPYVAVAWIPGYDSLHQITGTVPLQVNRRTGELTCKPNHTGLFAFAIRVTEYRRGLKLGEMRREFQELILNCPLNRPPDMVLTVPGPPHSGPPLPVNTVLTLPPPGSGEPRCLNVYVTDPDPTTRLQLRVVPLDSARSNPVLSVTSGVVNGAAGIDTLYSRLCFADCFALSEAPLRFYLIATDEGCPQPMPDTVLLTVRAPFVAGTPEPPANIFTPDGDGFNNSFLPGAVAITDPCTQVIFRRLRIFNRWGREVFSTTDEQGGWDGRDSGPGTYFYLLEYADRTYKGWVDLVR